MTCHGRVWVNPAVFAAASPPTVVLAKVQPAEKAVWAVKMYESREDEALRPT